METGQHDTYTRTVQTDGLGLTLVTEQGYSEREGRRYDDLTYTHGNRTVRIHMLPNAEHPNQRNIRDRAYADYYENGEKTGPRRSYNILENAQIKAVRWVMRLDTDAKAGETLRGLRRPDRKADPLATLPLTARYEAEHLARRLGLDPNGDMKTLNPLYAAYARAAEDSGLAGLLEQRAEREHALSDWIDANPGGDMEDAPGWREYAALNARVEKLRRECARTAAGNAGMADRLD